jgi:hypothetical protein
LSGVLEAFRKIYPEILTAAKEGSNVLEKAKLISDRSAARANFLASIGQALFKGLEQIFDVSA